MNSDLAPFLIVIVFGLFLQLALFGGMFLMVSNTLIQFMKLVDRLARESKAIEFMDPTTARVRGRVPHDAQAGDIIVLKDGGSA